MNETSTKQLAVIGVVLFISAAILLLVLLPKKEVAVQTNEIQDIFLEQRRQAVKETADFVTANMYTVPSTRDAVTLLIYSVTLAPDTGMFLEMGVGKGQTIRIIATQAPTREVHGFDSFEGLPEAWRGNYQKGEFASTPFPIVPTNVTLHKGWFKDSLPVWKEKHPGPIAFLHVDSDLYSSAKDTFDNIGTQLMDGAIVQFDEYFNYPGWQLGEAKAWNEFAQAHKVRYEFIGYNVRGEQVALRVLSMERK